jgi:hypothetical protein
LQKNRTIKSEGTKNVTTQTVQFGVVLVMVDRGDEEGADQYHTVTGTK